MEGLEATEISLASLEKTKRIDSEYYQKTLLKYENAIVNNKNSYTYLSKEADFLIGPFGSAYDTSNYVENSNYRYIRGQDVKPFILKDNEPRFMTEEDYLGLERYALKENDILISVVGTLGNVCIVQKKDTPAIFSCKSTAIRTRAIKQTYIVSYLNSKYGRSLLLRKERGAIQKGLNLDDLKDILIPIVSNNFEKEIDIAFWKAQDLLEQSKDKFREAEKNLLEMLGLENWQPTPALSYERQSSEVFAAGRLDAEHFQEKYIQLKRKLKEHKSGFLKLGEICSNPVNGVEIREYTEEGTPYLRVGDLQNFDLNIDSVVRISKQDSEKVDKVTLDVGDVLVSRSGSLAVTGVVEAEWVDSVISSHLIRVRLESKNFNPYYIAAFLAWMPGKMQIQQWSNGGVQPEINQPSLKEIIIPMIDMNEQLTIKKIILQARQDRMRAKELLEAAKRAVEIAIENSEAAALAYLQPFLQDETP